MALSFSEHEQKGREKALKYLKDWGEITFTEDPYAPYDAEIKTKGNNTIILEIKDRDIPSTKYDTYLLEKTKYDSLKEIPGIHFYVNFFNDGVVGLWNLDRIDTTDRWITEYCTTTTANNTYGLRRKPKEVLMLTKDEAVRFLNPSK